ncbi:MAG: hypothetical protein AAB685_02095 [Patescibacteria group bacterium]
MKKNNQEIASLSMDLKRVALGFWGGSNKTANLFTRQALRRKEVIDHRSVKVYLMKFLNELPAILAQKDKKKVAEDALMYSTIFQNYATHN